MSEKYISENEIKEWFRSVEATVIREARDNEELRGEAYALARRRICPSVSNGSIGAFLSRFGVPKPERQSVRSGAVGIKKSELIDIIMKYERLYLLGFTEDSIGLSSKGDLTAVIALLLKVHGALPSEG